MELVDLMRDARVNINDNVLVKVRANIGSSVMINVWWNLRHNVRDNVWWNVRDNVLDNTNNHIYSSRQLSDAYSMVSGI